MNQSFFDHPNWYHSIALAERIGSLHNVQGTTLKVVLNTDHGAQRLQCWRSQPPFRTGSYFERRLAMDGMAEEDLLYFLSEPPEAVRDRFSTPPEWLAEVDRAFSCTSARSTSSKTPPRWAMMGFLNVIEPLVSHGRDCLYDAVQTLVQTHTDLPFDVATVEHLLFANMPPRLLEMLSRTMALELNVARLQGFLEGDTPEARFRSFLERLRRRDIALALLQEYPVLARALTMYIDRWVAVNLEFLLHLCGDWEAIRTTFSPEHDPGMLVQLTRAGHEYRGGRSVQIAKFSSGFKIVYKPRSLALDVHFQELVAWINDRGAHPPLAALKLLDRSTYGWVEFVTSQSCSSLDEIRRFYERQGGYLALLYALEATDFHFRNVIAKGEQPVLIDLEALFHPRLESDGSEQMGQLAGDPFGQSVLRVGLLPERLWSTPEFEGVDISGLGAVAGQPAPYLVPDWERSGTDEMCLVHKRGVLSGGQNRPSLNGAEVDVLEHAEAVAAGFMEIYHLLLKYRRDLLANDGPVSRFADDEVRVFLRSSHAYEILLRESYHPDMLRDALDRDRLFDWLWAAVENGPYLTEVIPAEREDLWKGDIPIFTTRPGSRHLWTSSNERITNFFNETTMNRVKHRIQQLSEDDLSHQLSLIRASLVGPTMVPDQVRPPSGAATQPEPK